MVLAKLRELPRAGRAGCEVIDPGLRFLERKFAGGYRFEDVGPGTTSALGVWIAVKKRAP
jgi:hypothetical protein